MLIATAKLSSKDTVSVYTSSNRACMCLFLHIHMNVSSTILNHKPLQILLKAMNPCCRKIHRCTYTEHFAYNFYEFTDHLKTTQESQLFILRASKQTCMNGSPSLGPWVSILAAHLNHLESFENSPCPGHFPDQVNQILQKKIQVLVNFLPVFQMILTHAQWQEPPQFRRGLKKDKKKSFEDRKPEFTRGSRDLRPDCRCFYFHGSVWGAGGTRTWH